MQPVVHFEIPLDDVAAGKTFYSAVFGWSMTDTPMGGKMYTSATTTPTDDTQLPTEPGAINGALIQREITLQAPVIVVGVDSLDTYIKKIEDAGGQVVKAKQELPGVGSYAYVSDPQGNVLGLWQDAKPAK
ncbi:MAG TPA: VOC family protein [Candidatus Saccharimonadales bacterium]|nr:VOC family protein [Candidatus Saccharimonadales bacterium]